MSVEFVDAQKPGESDEQRDAHRGDERKQPEGAAGGVPGDARFEEQRQAPSLAASEAISTRSPSTQVGFPGLCPECW